MAQDGSAAIDTLGWSGAHVIGVSLGGLIAQVLADRHTDRVLADTALRGNLGFMTGRCCPR